MTAQTPERIILDGRPRSLFADPLYRLTARCRLDLSRPDHRSTANYRGYIGTWEIRDGRLYLVHLAWETWGSGGQDGEMTVAETTQRKLFRAAQVEGFPILAHWFNGRLRIALGRRLIYSHHGWSSWFERERVIHFRAGEIVRDREVDTRAILEWWLRRDPERSEQLQPSQGDGLRPLIWFDEEDDAEWEADWWPPDYPRPVDVGGATA